MKEGFRQSMAWLHTWTGLVVGWVLYFVFMTGTAGYFDEEITRWMKPEAPLVTMAPPFSTATAVRKAQELLNARAPEAQRWSIDPSWERTERNWMISWSMPAPAGASASRADGEQRPGQRRARIMFDPSTGIAHLPADEPKVRETDGGLGLYRLHYQFHYISHHSALLIVGLCTMLMFLAILSGVVTHKKIFKDFFTFRPGKGQRSWLDMHNVISVTALPFFLMITYSGLVFFMYAYMPAAMTAAYGMDKEWPNDGYSNPLNPRTNNRFDGATEGDGMRRARTDRMRATDGHSSAPPAPLADLAPLAEEAERQWGKGAIGGISITNPGRSDARVTIIFLDNRLARSARKQILFDGVTGANISPSPFQQGGTWKVQNVLIALHEGLFAGPLLRWLYFLSGLLGCAMIATGLILWTVKRRQKQRSEGDAFSFRLVETLNIGTIAGLPMGIAAYFWANRLLPAGLEGRAEWEYHSLFSAMGAALIWATIRRPASRAWTEILWIAALAFLLLPLVNALTTDRHLGVSIAAGDWVLAGFDATMLALGSAIAVAALKIHRRSSAPALRRHPRHTVQTA